MKKDHKHRALANQTASVKRKFKSKNSITFYESDWVFDSEKNKIIRKKNVGNGHTPLAKLFVSQPLISEPAFTHYTSRTTLPLYHLTLILNSDTSVSHFAICWFLTFTVHQNHQGFKKSKLPKQNK
jgi:hypothetical protein